MATLCVALYEMYSEKVTHVFSGWVDIRLIERCKDGCSSCVKWGDVTLDLFEHRVTDFNGDEQRCGGLGVGELDSENQTALFA